MMRFRYLDCYGRTRFRGSERTGGREMWREREGGRLSEGSRGESVRWGRDWRKRRKQWGIGGIAWVREENERLREGRDGRTRERRRGRRRKRRGRKRKRRRGRRRH
jgi:hypothetical protein